MKYLITLLLVFLFTNHSYAQGESAISKTTVNAFQENYNNSNYESIFSMFSPEMKNFMPHDKAISFLKGLKSEAGDFKSKSFVKYPQTKVALYKAQFERILIALFISTDANSKINGLMVKPFEEEKIPTPERNTSKLRLPFNEEWTVLWGGDSKEENYHVIEKSQKNAFDFVITNKNGKSYTNDGTKNEDFYAFGKTIVAAADGEVVLVVDGVKDNKPGQANPLFVPGNTVIIKTNHDEYLFYAHFKQHSILVKQGQQVKQGDVLGLCGNSGNSTEPHIHFHIQNVENSINATGIKAFFEEIRVNGAIQNDYSLVKSDQVIEL